jgi:6-phosphogluconolactonase
MPMAVSPDKRFLIAAVRSKPFQAYSYSIDNAIDAETGALKPIGRYPTGKGANWVEIVAFD